MFEWNFNMSEAPSGSVKTIQYARNGEMRTREVFEPSRVLVSHHHTKTVSVSWKSESGRWNGYKAGQEPLAWMPLPKSAQEEMDV